MVLYGDNVNLLLESDYLLHRSGSLSSDGLKGPSVGILLGLKVLSETVNLGEPSLRFAKVLSEDRLSRLEFFDLEDDGVGVLFFVQ